MHPTKTFRPSLAAGLLLLLLGSHNPVKASSDFETLRDIAAISASCAIVLGGAYCIGTYCGQQCYTTNADRYAGIFDVLDSTESEATILSEALIRYTLKEHIETVDQNWFSYDSDNYPLVNYINDLDSSRSWMRFFAFFQNGSALGKKMHALIEKMTEVRRAIISDYRYIKEKREFDEWQEQKKHNKKLEQTLDGKK